MGYTGTYDIADAFADDEVLATRASGSQLT